MPYGENRRRTKICRTNEGGQTSSRSETRDTPVHLRAGNRSGAAGSGREGDREKSQQSTEFFLAAGNAPQLSAEFGVKKGSTKFVPIDLFVAKP
jgi:hypothetical protein